MGRPKQLPYIIIEHPRLTLRFLIDTGAEFSVINDNLCGSKWKHDVNVSLRAMEGKLEVRKLVVDYIKLNSLISKIDFQFQI